MLISVELTVLFNDPFWIGVFEVNEGKNYKSCKVTFGAEPKDAEVFDFILRNYYKLSFFKKELTDKKDIKKKVNPKRLQRDIRKQLEKKEIGTKAQIALKEQYEATKIEGKKIKKEKKEIEKIRKFEIKQNKKKEKHKGH